MLTRDFFETDRIRRIFEARETMDNQNSSTPSTRTARTSTPSLHPNSAYSLDNSPRLNQRVRSVLVRPEENADTEEKLPVHPERPVRRSSSDVSSVSTEQTTIYGWIYSSFFRRWWSGYVEIRPVTPTRKKGPFVEQFADKRNSFFLLWCLCFLSS